MHAWTDPAMCVSVPSSAPPPSPPTHTWTVGERIDGAKSVNSYPALLGYTFFVDL